MRSFAHFAVKIFNRKERKGNRKGRKERLKPLLFSAGAFALAASRCISSRQKRRPAQFLRRILIAKRFVYSHFRDRIHDPIEVLLTHGMDVGIRRRVEEVDGIGNAVFYRELHRVQVVTQRPAQGLRIFYDPVQQLGIGRCRIFHIALVMRRLRIVVHDVDFFLPDHIAAKIFFELDAMLQGHAQVAGLVVVMEKFLRRVDLVHMLPSSTGIRLEESREADVVKNFFPVQRINQVAHGLVGRAFGMFVMRQDHSRRNGHAQLRRQRVVEEFVVGGPPERDC